MRVGEPIYKTCRLKFIYIFIVSLRTNRKGENSIFGRFPPYSRTIDPTVGCTTLTLSSIPQFHDKFPTNMFTSSRIVARTGARLPAGCTYSFIPRLHCSTPLFLSLSTGRSFRKCGYFLQNGRGVSTRMPFEHLHRSRITLACPLSADLSLTQP